MDFSALIADSRPTVICFWLGTTITIFLIINKQQRDDLISLEALKNVLELQQRTYRILNKLDIAIIELETDTNKISYSNDAGFQLLQSLYKQQHKEVTRMPSLLEENRFFSQHFNAEQLSE